MELLHSGARYLRHWVYLLPYNISQTRFNRKRSVGNRLYKWGVERGFVGWISASVIHPLVLSNGADAYPTYEGI